MFGTHLEQKNGTCSHLFIRSIRELTKRFHWSGMSGYQILDVFVAAHDAYATFTRFIS